MSFQIATGTYTGDGNDNRSITGVGFQGNWIMIIPDDTEESTMRTSANGGDATQIVGQNTIDFADAIQQFEADGFQLGTSAVVNQDTKNYYYTVIQMDSLDSKTGTYTGDGNDDRSIGSVGFQPTYVIIKGAGARYAAHLPIEAGTNNSLVFDNASAAADQIQQLEADGFQLGSGALINTDTETYYYEAFLDVTNSFETGSYVGNAPTDNRSISVGFQPEFVIVKGNEGRYARLRNDAITGDASKPTFDGAGLTTNAIQTFEADGFVIGTHDHVNANGETYYWMAWKSPPGGVSAAVASGYMTTNTKFW